MARARLVSFNGSTWMAPLSIVALTSPCSTSCSAPLGPFTLTVWPSTFAVTPEGTGTAFLPIRDMVFLLSCPPPSEHGAEHFAANVGVACIVVRHHALRRRNDRNAQAVVDARQVAHGDIHPAARLGDTRHLA